MISSLSWVRRGAALAIPRKCDLNDEQIGEISKRLNIPLEGMQESEWQDASDEEDDERSDSDQEDAVDSHSLENEPNSQEMPDMQNLDISGKQEDDDDLTRYKMDDYDEETVTIDPAMIIGNFKDMLYFGNKSDTIDPYLDTTALSEEEEEEEAKELVISETDSLIVVANTVEEVNYLEVYVYDEANDNLYVHHDLMIPSFPLCTEWFDCKPTCAGNQEGSNFVAVGTLDPEIEIWNLDVLDTPVPEAILGTNPNERHSDSVMSLAWNRQHTNMLLSGSADQTIKLWDLKATACLRTFSSIHADKIQSVQWNPFESSQILSGSFDKTVCIFDARSSDDKLTLQIPNEPECLRWNPHNQFEFLLSDECGHILAYDSRNLSKAQFVIQAHSKPVTAVDWNPFVPGFFVSLSADKSAKLWTVTQGPDCPSGKPELVSTKTFSIGKLFCGSFCQDAPHLFAMGGSRGNLLLWNLNENSTFCNKYKSLF